MRLYLSSFRLGTQPQHLRRLIGEGESVAVIANAIDGEPGQARADKVAAEMRALRSLGLPAAEVDLRDLRGASPSETRSVLRTYQALWVRGGNVFLLRAALALCGGDEAVRRLLAEDAVVYAGYSAGPCVLGPSLAGLERVDDASLPQTMGLGGPWTDGLGVLAERFVPHVSSPSHPSSLALDAVARGYAEEGIAYVGLRDGEALLVDGDRREVVGRPTSTEELMAAYPP